MTGYLNIICIFKVTLPGSALLQLRITAHLFQQTVTCRLLKRFQL